MTGEKATVCIYICVCMCVVLCLREEKAYGICMYYYVSKARSEKVCRMYINVCMCVLLCI